MASTFSPAPQSPRVVNLQVLSKLSLYSEDVFIGGAVSGLVALHIKGQKIYIRDASLTFQNHFQVVVCL